MHLYRTEQSPVVEVDGKRYRIGTPWNELFLDDHLAATLRNLIECAEPDATLDNLSNTALAPIADQEIWAAGVTYFRSRTARMDESRDAGGGDFYDRVYDADRPEIFFKATAIRTVGHGESMYLRDDSKWICLLYTSPSPRDQRGSRMPSSA